MNDTSGPTSGTQFAYYDHDSHSWKMWPDTGLWGSIEFSETWPKTGCMSDGRAYELPASVPHITANVSSSSSVLPTPMAQHSGNTPENHLRKKPGRKVVTDLAILVENDLIKTGGMLPTPTVGNATGTNERRGGKRSGEKLLPGVVLDFLPTPTASDADKARDNPAQAKRKSPPISAVSQYFPTPNAVDGEGGRFNSKGHQSTLPGTVRELAQLTGALTDPLFDDGNGLLDQLPRQLS